MRRAPVTLALEHQELVPEREQLQLEGRPRADEAPQRSISLHWEFMFTRARYETVDVGEQGQLLNEVPDLVDAGLIRSTIRADLGPITAANLKRAYARSSRAAARSARSCS